MRSVCFVDHLEFEFKGSVFKNGISLGDVDNDGEMELIIGNISGDLAIFKHDSCWQRFNNLGMIIGIGVGDIMNCGSNALVIISGDGWCHIYLCLHPKSEDEESTTDVRLELVHVQYLPANTKVILLEDVDGDGNIELVIGLTDRVVRSYRWVQSATGGRLVCLYKWECANQIGGLALNYNAEGLPEVLVSQPGGTVVRIKIEHTTGLKFDKDPTKSFHLLSTSLENMLLDVSKMRSPGITTEIIANMSNHNKDDESKAKPYVIATQDGTLNFIRDEEILWSYQVDQLFMLNKLDVTNDGRDDIIACAWDGLTYILDQDKNGVRFQFEEPVVTFCAGKYTVKPGSPPVTCFVYVTFQNKIVLYYNINIPSMQAVSVLPLLQQSEEMAALVGEHVLNNEEEMRKLIRWCLYKPSSGTNT